MTLKDLYDKGWARLKDAGVEDAAHDAELLLLMAFSMDLNTYLLNRNAALLEDESARKNIRAYLDFIEKRALRVPLQQIAGCTEFCGLEFKVRENVLIPRQDTETLVEQVLADLDDLKADAGSDKLTLLDLCTGSGCIAVSLAIKGDFYRVAAADISEEALDAARENAAVYLPDTIEFYQGDLFSALPRQTPPFSVITANPPYIPSDVISTLQPEVRDHEPRLALDGSFDGLEFYRRIAAGVRPYLAAGGRIYLELGYDQGPAVKKIFTSAGFADVSVLPDLCGNDRVAVIKS